MTDNYFKIKTRCTECDAYIWSDWFRALGVCAECHSENLGPKELQERFEEISPQA